MYDMSIIPKRVFINNTIMKTFAAKIYHSYKKVAPETHNCYNVTVFNANKVFFCVNIHGIYEVAMDISEKDSIAVLR